MDPVALFDDASWRITRRHESWIRDLNVLREGHLDRAGTPQAVNYFMALDSALESARFDMGQIVSSEMPRAAQLGMAAAQGTQVIELDEQMLALNRMVDAGLMRDAAHCANGMRRDALEYRAAILRHGSPMMARMRIRGQLGGTLFTQLNAAGRRIQSTQFIATTVRGTLVQTYAMALCFAMLETGKTRIIVSHPERAGAELQLSEFDAWAEENLHPNARWTLEAP